MKQYLGLEIGGTKTSVWLGETNKSGICLLGHRIFPTPPDPKDCLPQMKEAGDDLLKAFPGELCAIGISCGSPLDSKYGIIQTPPNLPLWQDVAITDWAYRTWGVPAYLQNDADACALAEWQYGAGKGTRNMIFLTCGTGFGAGLILNGQLYSGSIGMGGEIGHVRLADQGPVGYGKRGSAEGFCSGGGIRQIAETYVREALQAGEKPAWAEKDFSAKDVALAAKNGDPTAIRVWEEAGYWLGRAVSILVDLLNPEKIVLGSIYQLSGDLMKPAMEKVLKAECLPANLSACEITACALGEEMGGYGCMAIAEIFGR